MDLERLDCPLVPELELWLYPDLLVEDDSAFPSYFAVAWPAGEALARFVLDQPETVRDKVVLDFGTGSGVVALAAARAGARRVVGVDRDRRAIEALARNASRAGATIEGRVADPLRRRLDVAGVDVVLGADVLYEDAHPSRVARWLRRQVSSERRVIVSDPGRVAKTWPGMKALCMTPRVGGRRVTIFELRPVQRRVGRGAGSMRSGAGEPP